MKVRSGGYQTGRSYAWYRSMGHNPLPAYHMRWSDTIFKIGVFILAGLLGYSWGLLVTGGL